MIAICFLVDAHPFPPIFLAIKLKGGAIRGEDGGIICCTAELPQLAISVLFEERYVGHAKLYSSFGVISRGLYGVLTHSEEVIKCDQ